jgi:deoxycytidylate deaminase
LDKWDARFMELADTISGWASCYKADRKIGAVIVKNKRIVTTGYNGAPAGIKTCVERGECLRQKLGIALAVEIVFTLTIMACRMILGAHFLSDVSVGALVGVVAFLVLLSLQARQPRQS